MDTVGIDDDTMHRCPYCDMEIPLQLVRYSNYPPLNRPHETCIDVTQMQNRPRSEWVCGPHCPKEENASLEP
jgi:hypothetical protein